MKPVVLIFLLVLINSCASLDRNNIAPGYIQAFYSIKEALAGSDSKISPDLIKNIPYASMLVKIGKGPEALMILESVNNENYTWVSADGVYLVINNGKIIKTSGLPNNLSEILLPSIDWDDNFLRKTKFISYFSYTLPKLNNLKVISTYSIKETRNVDLTFKSKNLKLIEERIIASEVGWSKTNRYWLDDEKFIWKSQQNISPRLPVIYYEVTKKPR